MKKILNLLYLLPFMVAAQSTDQNFVKTITYRDSANTATARIDVTYFDGLGRPIQKIAGKMSGAGTDLITSIEYDSLGREKRDYLPYPATTTNLAFVSSAVTDAVTYYSTSNELSEHTSYPYSEKFFEKSPLNRVLKQAAPGDPWHGNTNNNNDHSVKMAYLSNIANEVKLITVTASAPTNVNGPYGISNYSVSGYYSAGQLYKTITQDENKTGSIYTGTTVSAKLNTIEEFKDKKGQLVLKRTFNYNGSSYETLDTYYVYDQYGNLTYVLPPKAQGALTYLDDLCYQYKYDRHNRMIEKKLPGKQWEYIVYDALDRVIATGPAINPFGGITASNTGWLRTYYDGLGRVAYTVWEAATVNASSRTTLQGQYAGAAISIIRGSGTIDGISLSYAVFSNTQTLLTVNYYDDYTWTGAASIPSNVEQQNVATLVKGLSTGTWVRILNATSTIKGETTTNFYDRKGRNIRIYSTNFLGGYMQTDTKLDFDGTALYTVTKQKRLSGDTERVITDNFTYTPQDRLLSHTHLIGNGTNLVATATLANNTYNGLGQLSSKNVGVSSGTPLQAINYKYNIRGWLTDINDATNLGSDIFAFHIGYNNVTDPARNGLPIPALYNGNIAETWWISSSDNTLRQYSYKYDNLNRLRNAYYQKPNASIVLTQSYNEAAAYDKNGNITSMTRNGSADDPTTPVQIDNLAYTYQANSNQLVKVVDNSNSTQGFKDSAANTVNDYSYDANGNIILDNNKGISSITYNHLNLPVVITFSTGSITYLYNAAGVKLQKTVSEVQNGATVTMVVDYLSGFQYKAGNLKFFPTSEGYVSAVLGLGGVYTYNYVYQYKDHLGNVRMNYARTTKSGTITIMDESHYYPFGLQHQNYNMTALEFQEIDGTVDLYPHITTSGSLTYNYRYQEQERQDELGLNWDSFKWRNYDYAIGRFMNIDPLAEKYAYNSTYAFQENKMGLGRELEGLELSPAGNYLTSETNKVVESVKTTASNIWNGITEGLSNMGDAISEWENGLGGYNFTSDMRSSNDPSSGSGTKRSPKNGQHVETVDATGLDLAGGFATAGKGKSTGDGMTNSTSQAKNWATTTKKVTEKFKKGMSDVKRGSKLVKGANKLATDPKPVDTTYTVTYHTDENSTTIHTVKGGATVKAIVNSNKELKPEVKVVKIQ